MEYRSLDSQTSSGSGHAQRGDPFYDVKDTVHSTMRELQIEYDQWKSTSETKDDAEKLKRLKTKLRKLQSHVKDLERTNGIVEENRSRFKDISNDELDARKRFVSEMRGRIKEYNEKLKAEKQRATENEKVINIASESRLASENDYVSRRFESHQMVQEKQDLVLDDMAGALERLGVIAGDINTELATQKDMLDELDAEMDETQTNFDIVMAKMQKLLGTSDKGKLCCIFWLFLTMVFLFFLVVYT